MGFRACSSALVLCCAGNQTQGSVHATQTPLTKPHDWPLSPPLCCCFETGSLCVVPTVLDPFCLSHLLSPVLLSWPSFWSSSSPPLIASFLSLPLSFSLPLQLPLPFSLGSHPYIPAHSLLGLPLTSPQPPDSPYSFPVSSLEEKKGGGGFRKTLPSSPTPERHPKVARPPPDRTSH